MKEDLVEGEHQDKTDSAKEKKSKTKYTEFDDDVMQKESKKCHLIHSTTLVPTSTYSLAATQKYGTAHQFKIRNAPLPP